MRSAGSQVSTVVGNEHLVETEVLQPAELAGNVGEASIRVYQHAEFQYLRFGYDCWCNRRLRRSIPRQVAHLSERQPADAPLHTRQTGRYS